MSMSVPFFTGFLRRRRETKDFTTQTEADLIKALEKKANSTRKLC